MLHTASALRSIFFIFVSVTSFARLAKCSPTFVPVLPPSYPLAVRNPYLSAWLPGKQVESLASAQAQFWTGQILTWSVMARVNGTAYSLFGVPNAGTGVRAASLQSAEYTSTHTTFSLTAGPASFILDFLSPISPTNLTRQSMPFSYLTISTSSQEQIDVQVYSDIDNSWAGQFGEDIGTLWEWASSVEGTQILTLTPGGTAYYSEFNNMAQWGTAVYCTRSNKSNMTAAVGDMTAVRAEFVANGSLPGSWLWQPGSVIAFSQELGNVSSQTNVTFAVGYWRPAAVNYMGSPRTTYFTSTCSNTTCACVSALDDFPAAAAEARNVDSAVARLASATAGSNYSDIVTLSARQAFGALDITIPESSLNTSDIMIFLKEISSDGNVNTLDVIFPLSPLLYVMAPDYIRLLLEPVLQYLATGSWPHNYAIHDIGSNYPNATGHDDGVCEQMPLEECGDLLILAYMYQLASGDAVWYKRYQSIFREYADYLVANSLYPKAQLDSDDDGGSPARQTGLAIKSAVALNAYGAMVGLRNYSDVGTQFAEVLYNQSAATDAGKTHFTEIEGKRATWAMEYNLYMDVLLNLSTFPSDAYAMQSSWYSSVRQPAGVPLDSSVNWGKTDWMHFAAATAMAKGVGNAGVRDMFIDDVHEFMSNGQNTVPFSDRYFVNSSEGDVQGTWDVYRARPVVGGHFAVMALNGPNQIQVGGAGYAITSEPAVK